MRAPQAARELHQFQLHITSENMRGLEDSIQLYFGIAGIEDAIQLAAAGTHAPGQRVIDAICVNSHRLVRVSSDFISSAEQMWPNCL